MGQKYLEMEDQKPGLVLKKDVAKVGGLEPKINVFKISLKFFCGGAVKNYCNSNVSQTRVWRRGP